MIPFQSFTKIYINGYIGYICRATKSGYTHTSPKRNTQTIKSSHKRKQFPVSI